MSDGIAREYLHDAARGIATEERSLWPLRYLQVIDTGEARHGGRSRRHVHTVDVQRHGGLVAGLSDGSTHAAQERNRGIGLTVEQQTGHEGRKGLPIRNAHFLRIVRAEGRYPDRNSLVGLLPSGRSDDDFL